jgi:putative oxidoreductase
MASRSSHRLLSRADGLAQSSDALLLVGRILIASVFALTAWGGSPNPGYLGSLGLSNPIYWSWVAIAVEVVISITLILGVATRYGVLLTMLYVIVATVLAHRYWQYPAAAQGVQYIFLTKNLAIFGGLFVLFVTGAGKYSVDEQLRK